jgi:hypothetical protein
MRSELNLKVTWNHLHFQPSLRERIRPFILFPVKLQ